jgi:hypothetical protein
MAERFAYINGTLSVTSGASVVTGTDTIWGNRDRAGGLIIGLPPGLPPVLIGVVAETTPRNSYSNTMLPLVQPYNGMTLTGVPYILIDGLAIANSATLAGNLARFNAFLEENAGLALNDADDFDEDAVPNNSLIIDNALRVIYQLRNGVREVVSVVGAVFTPRGAYSGAVTYAKNDLVTNVAGTGIFVSNHDANLNNTPPAVGASNTHWTFVPLQQGPQGEQGVPGEQGQAGTITIGTVTTLDDDDPATVENVGTPSEAVLNFGIPQGPPGQGVQIDAEGTFAGRAAFDDEEAGFVYASTDGDGGVITLSVLFLKESNVSGDWSDPIPLQGPQGPPGQDGAGVGDVVGPAGGVTNGHAVLFDGVTGKLIKSAGFVPASVDALVAHVNSTTDAHDASAISFAPASGVGSSNVQAAIAELDAEKASIAALAGHTSAINNPHNVTKTQVGLANVSNDAQLKIASNLSDLNNAITARQNLLIVTLTQAAYNGITPNANTLYFITDA